MGATCLAFQVLSISGPKLNSAIKISSNSSTSSSTMVKFSNANVLFGVKTKSWIVFKASLRPDSAGRVQTTYQFGLLREVNIHNILRVT